MNVIYQLCLKWIPPNFLAQLDCGANPGKLKPRVDSLSEGGVEGVEEGQWGTGGDQVEGQCPRWPVQKDCHSVGAGCDGQSGVCGAVHGPEAIVCTAQAPGGVVPAQPAVVFLSLPAHTSVGYSYASSPVPFCLPVAPAAQSLLTQHLSPVIKPLGVVGIRLLSPTLRFPVLLGQSEVFVCCVWVQAEFGDIWFNSTEMFVSVKCYPELFYEIRRKQRSRSTKCWLLTFPWTWLNPGFTTFFHTRTAFFIYLVIYYYRWYRRCFFFIFFY